MKKISSTLSAHFPDFSEELVNFWIFFATLVFGVVFFASVLQNMLDRQDMAEGLQQQLSDLQVQRQALEVQIAELSRLNKALLPSSNPAEEGLDWETLKYLSFARFDKIAADEGIIHFKDFDID